MPCHTTGLTQCRCSSEHNCQDSDHKVNPLVRKLFADHSWYTAEFINATIYDLPTGAALKKRLLENQTEIGSELGKFSSVGIDNGKAIGKLLTKHIVLANGVLQAAVKSKPLKKPVDAFFKQGDDMATTLAGVLDMESESLIKEFRTHNQHVITLAQMLLKGQTNKKYIQELDSYQNHMLHLADVISSAL